MASSQPMENHVEMVDISSPADSLVEPLPLLLSCATSNENQSLTLAAPTSLPSSPSDLPSIPKNRRRPRFANDSQKVTMTGTVMRGSSSGQPVEVEVELTEREYQRLTSKECMKQDKEKCDLSLRQGPHIILSSFVCIPIAFIISLCLSFYNGSLTWYNLFIYFSEEKSIIHRISICPFLILSFPVLVGLSSLILAMVASVLQISWSWMRWKMEIRDGEKGFYGWLCGAVHLPDCSPYQDYHSTAREIPGWLLHLDVESHLQHQVGRFYFKPTTVWQYPKGFNQDTAEG